MKPDIPSGAMEAQIARIARHLGNLAEEQGPLLFLTELQALFDDGDETLIDDLGAIFCQPSDVHPPGANIDWQAQEKMLAALVATRFAA